MTTANEPKSPSQDRCVRCGYELVGFDDSAVCPECALPTTTSRRATALTFADIGFLKLIRFGAALAVMGIFAWVLSKFVGIVTSALPAAGTFEETIAFVATSLSFAGWFLMTARDPSGVSESWFRWKRPLRWLLIVCWIHALGDLVHVMVPAARITLGNLGFGPFGGPKQNIETLTQMTWSAIELARALITLLYMRELARALGNTALANTCLHMIWIIPLLWTVFCLCFFLGPVVATCLVAVALMRTGYTAHSLVRAQELTSK